MQIREPVKKNILFVSNLMINNIFYKFALSFFIVGLNNFHFNDIFIFHRGFLKIFLIVWFAFGFMAYQPLLVI